jgi:hypothetical protein
MKSLKLGAKRKAQPFRKPNFAAILVILVLASALTGAGYVVVSSLKPKVAQLPPNLQNLPALPEVAPLPGDPVELALGTTKADWVLNGFDVEKTVNDPSVYENVSKEEARRLNLALPFVKALSVPAPSFFVSGAGPQDALKAQHCLSLAVYYEASSEALEGQYAVAQVVLNRVRHPAWPNSVCGVVFQGSERRTGCQFTFTCDGALSRPPTGRAWQIAQAVSSAALNGFVMPKVGYATHYHTDWVAPYWAPSLKKLVQVGSHIFYTWNGVGGNPPAFRDAYSRDEPWPRQVAATAPQLGLPDAEPQTEPGVAAWQGGAPGSMAPTGISQSTSVSGGSVGGFAPSAQVPYNGTLNDQSGAASAGSPQRTLVYDGGGAFRGPNQEAVAAGSTPAYSPQASQTTRASLPEPSLESLLPKYQPPAAASARVTLDIPPLVEQKRQEKRPRALDGL